MPKKKTVTLASLHLLSKKVEVYINTGEAEAEFVNNYNELLNIIGVWLKATHKLKYAACTIISREILPEDTTLEGDALAAYQLLDEELKKAKKAKPKGVHMEG